MIVSKAGPLLDRPFVFHYDYYYKTLKNVDIQKVHICWLNPSRTDDLSLPGYGSEYAAGMDIGAAVENPVCLEPLEIQLIPTNICVSIPHGYEIQVRPRSGLAVKHGITIINSPGTIDSDYRGEIRIGVINLGREPFTIERGDRIAQLILAPVARADIELVDELDATERGNGGFGHTGV